MADNLNPTERAVLGAIARLEVFRDCYDQMWQHKGGETVELKPWGHTARIIARLEADGLVECPPEMRGERRDRFYDVTPKALEVPRG